jgi:hypothetical protein
MEFKLKGHNIEVSYSPGSTPGGPTLSYKDGSISRSFTKDEVHTDSTALGSLVSISLNPRIMPAESNIGEAGVTFAFFLPLNINVPQGQTEDFTTVALQEEGPVLPPPRPVKWQTFVMHGTAHNISIPV